METVYDPILDKMRSKDAGGTSGGIPPVPGAVEGDSVILNSNGTLKTLNASKQFIQPNCGWGETNLGTLSVTTTELKLAAPFTFYNSKGRAVTITTDKTMVIYTSGAFLYALNDAGDLVVAGQNSFNLKDYAPVALVSKHLSSVPYLIDFRVSKDAPYSITSTDLSSDYIKVNNGFELNDLQDNDHNVMTGGNMYISSKTYYVANTDQISFSYLYDSHLEYIPTLKNSKLILDPYDSGIGKYYPLNSSPEDIPIGEMVWMHFIGIPTMNQDMVTKLAGTISHSSVVDAKKDLYPELGRIQDYLGLNFKPLFIESVLIDRNGKVLDSEIIRDSVINALPILLSENTKLYKEVIKAMSAGSTYTLPTDYEVGERIQYLFDSIPPTTIRPAPTQRLKYTNSTFSPPYGVGFTYASMSQWGNIVFEYAGNNEWKVVSWSGRFIYEGVKIWLPLDTAPFVQPSQNVWSTIIRDKMFNQNLQGNDAIFTAVDSPYYKENNTYSDINFGIFHDNCIEVGQYGDAELVNQKNLNPFASLTGDFTIEFWFKRTTDSQGYDRTFIECGMAHNYKSYRIYFDDADKPAMILSGDSVTDLTLKSPDAVTSDNAWHRMTILKRGDRAALYIDLNKKDIGTIGHAVDTSGNFRLFNDMMGNYPYIGKAKDIVMVGNALYDIDIESSALLPNWVYSPNWLELTSGV